MYVTKENQLNNLIGMKKIIKVSIMPENADMTRYISDSFFKDFQFEINNQACNQCDFWVVFTDKPGGSEKVYINPDHVFFIDPEIDGFYSRSFLDQFSKVITADTHYKGANITYNYLGLPWFVQKKFDDLFSQENINKSKNLSVIVSDLSKITMTRNYKIRYNFVQELIRHFGKNIDLYGRGFNMIPDKGQGLWSYKFSVALENSPTHYLFSEKIADCLLTHTYPFYWGCPNIYSFFPEGSYTMLDIMDIKYSIDLIEKILNTPNFYEDHLDVLIRAKKKYLMEYSFQAVIVNLCKAYEEEAGQKKWVKISPNNKLRSRIKIRSINTIFNFLK